MTDKFDIIGYMAGMTAFVFDKDVLKRIAYDRNVYDVPDYYALSKKDKDLIFADLLYTAYISPTTWASSTHSHGSYSQTIGQQTLNYRDRESLYNVFIGIYKKYNDEMLTVVESVGGGTMQWL